MKSIVIGTGNPAKKNMVKSALKSLAIDVIGTDDLNIDLEIEEDGQTARENARKKSLTYAKATGRPVLSIDNALYLDGLDEEAQPGIRTRTVPGVNGRASDEQLLHFYREQVEQLGGQIGGRWESAVCIADENGRFFETTIISARTFVSKPSPRMVAGYPLESIQIDLITGQYMSELNQEEQDVLWQKMFGVPLCNFVQDALAQLLP